MTKNQYFKELKKQLKLYAIKESEDILKDYEEHFNEALSNGKTEDEICKSLGSPENVAKQYTTEDKAPKKKSNKKFFVLTIVFGVLMLYFGITTINLFFANGPDSNIFWMKEETIYYDGSETLDITFKNLSMKNYKDLKLSIVATDIHTGNDNLLKDCIKINIDAFGGITTTIDLDSYYYNDCKISIMYTDANNKSWGIMQEKDYNPMKIMIIVDSILFVVGIAGFLTFLPIYLVKRKNK